MRHPLRDFLYRPIHIACLLAAFASSGLLSACSGGSGSDTSEPQPRPLPRATAFADCGELRDYIVELAAAEAALRAQVGGAVVHGGFATTGGEAPTPAPGSDQALAEDREHTETNLQEPGVDEPDFVKSDGAYLYVLAGGNLVIVDAWPPEEAAEVGRLEIAGSPVALFVQGDVVAVVSMLWQDLPTLLPLGMPIRAPGLVRLTLVDAADKANPQVLRELTYEGYYSDARLVSGRLHLVLSNYLPSLWQADEPATSGDVADLLPLASDRLFGSGGAAESIESATACADTYFPSVPNGVGLVSLVTLDLGDPTGPVRSTALVTESGTVYASAESLYLATPNTGVWGWWDASGQASDEPQLTTVVHKFTLGAEPAYAASGEVAGWVLNRYSMSEHSGAFRVATTEDRWWDASGPRNRLFVLAQDGQSLKEVGSLAGLGKEGERIYAVRFLADLGYAVTFRQIDPLYVLDLSDPAAPAVVGELEVPGFSTYLHPLDGGFLLAVGQNVDQGGVDLSLFDVRDPAQPGLVHRLSVGAGSYSSAQYDPHAFTYFAAEGLLALPMTRWNGNPLLDAFTAIDVFSGLHLYQVDTDTGFTLQAEIDHAEFYKDEGQALWYYPEPVDRSFFIRDQALGSYLYSVSRRGIKVTGMADFQDIAAVPLPAEDIYWIDAYPAAL